MHALLACSDVSNRTGSSSTQDDIVNWNEDQLDNVPDEANHDEAHSASLQNFHVLYSQ